MSEVVKFVQDNPDQDHFVFYYTEKDDEKEKIVSSAKYADRGVKLEGSSLGNLYEIIIISEKKKEMERFRAILISPGVYINRMMNGGFWGIVGLATTTSTEIFNEIERKIEKSLNNMKGIENV